MRQQRVRVLAARGQGRRQPTLPPPDILGQAQPLLVLVDIVLKLAEPLPGQPHPHLGLLQLGHLDVRLHFFITPKTDVQSTGNDP